MSRLRTGSAVALTSYLAENVAGGRDKIANTDTMFADAELARERVCEAEGRLDTHQQAVCACSRLLVSDKTNE